MILTVGGQGIDDEGTQLAHDERTPGSTDGSHVGVALADRFEVLAEIGSGATAITYRGRDTRLNRLVAIKILRHDLALDSTYVQRFEREAHVAASINHGNVVNVFDFGKHDDALYIVMQYIDGEDLKHLIVRQDGVDADRARTITVQVLAGLTAIHAGGILHRDIKPQNVLIGMDGVARLADFGVAHLPVDTGLTTVGTTVGTAAYMAPEQAQAGDLTEATDIYSVGVMLYEMLTGALPFAGATPLAMMLAHVQQAPGAPSTRRPDRVIPRHLDNVVLQAMAKDPRDRFQSAPVMSRVVEHPGTTTVDQATTALAAAPRVGDSQPTRALAGPGAAAASAWPAGERRSVSSSRPMPAGGQQEPSGMRAALGALMVLLLVAMTVVAAFLVYDYLQNDDADDDPPSAQEGGLPPDSTEEATSTEPGDETLPAAPTDEPTALPTEPPAEPTDVPTVPPTEPPTLVPTAVPTAVPTEPPTLEPTDEPLPSPTPTPPATEEQVIEPVDQEETEEVIEPNTESDTEQATTDLPITSWSGPDIDVDPDRNLVIIGPQEIGSVTFELADVPASESVELSLLGLTIGSDGVSFTLQVNGTDVDDFESTMPQYDGENGEATFDRMAVTIPSELLVAGSNELVIENLAPRATSLSWLQGDDDDDGSEDSPVRVELGSIVLNGATLTYEQESTPG